MRKKITRYGVANRNEFAVFCVITLHTGGGGNYVRKLYSADKTAGKKNKFPKTVFRKHGFSLHDDSERIKHFLKKLKFF
jgi:hypothetical protein